MKITCATEHFKTAVLIVERFTSRHVTLPILSHILLTVKEKKISLIATNLEVGIEYPIPGKVQKLGAVTVPARLITQVLQSITEEALTLEAHQRQLILHTPTSDATILGLDTSDFPTLPTITTEYSFTVPAEAFLTALHQVLPAVATTDLKPQLAGVFIAASGDTVTLVATDSFRLAEKTIPSSAGPEAAMECVVPSRTMQELSRTIPSSGEVVVRIGEHQALFEWDGARILSRLVDSAYPPYKNLIPKAFETTVAIERDDFLRKIHLAAVFSSRLNDITLAVSPSEVAISATNPEAGDTTSRLPAKGRGSAGSVVFNHRYLTDGLEAAGGGEVVLRLNGVAGPALIQNQTDPSFLYLLMPIRAV